MSGLNYICLAFFRQKRPGKSVEQIKEELSDYIHEHLTEANRLCSISVSGLLGDYSSVQIEECPRLMNYLAKVELYQPILRAEYLKVGERLWEFEAKEWPRLSKLARIGLEDRRVVARLFGLVEALRVWNLQTEKAFYMLIHGLQRASKRNK